LNFTADDVLRIFRERRDAMQSTINTKPAGAGK
jgi:hypothetical protein